MLELRDLGYEVRVLSKVTPGYDLALAKEFSEKEEIPVTTIPYVFKQKKDLAYYLKHLLPWNLDGAAYEYSHKETKQIFSGLLDEFKPDYVWFDYTYLWPLYNLAKSRGIKIITRSINFEARHFLQEDGYTPVNLIRYIPKFISELLTIAKTDWLFAITPEEQKTYERWGGKGKTSTLPLRGLAYVLDAPVPVKERDILKVFFMGSTYNVHHNKAALMFVIKDVAPLLKGGFEFHILGKKVPDDAMQYVKDNVIYDGYQDPKTFLQDMDIAIIPSLFGAGMQQKVFEPMALGIPLVTHERAIVGYNFVDGEHYVAASTPAEYAHALEHLRDPKVRRELSLAANKRSKELFSQDIFDKLVSDVLSNLRNK